MDFELENAVFCMHCRVCRVRYPYCSVWFLCSIQPCQKPSIYPTQISHSERLLTRYRALEIVDALSRVSRELFIVP